MHFKRGAIMNSVLRPYTILLYPSGDLCHSFAQAIQAVYNTLPHPLLWFTVLLLRKS